MKRLIRHWGHVRKWHPTSSCRRVRCCSRERGGDAVIGDLTFAPHGWHQKVLCSPGCSGHEGGHSAQICVSPWPRLGGFCVSNARLLRSCCLRMKSWWGVWKCHR